MTSSEFLESKVSDRLFSFSFYFIAAPLTGVILWYCNSNFNTIATIIITVFSLLLNTVFWGLAVLLIGQYWYTRDHRAKMKAKAEIEAKENHDNRRKILECEVNSFVKTVKSGVHLNDIEVE